VGLLLGVWMLRWEIQVPLLLAVVVVWSLGARGPCLAPLGGGVALFDPRGPPLWSIALRGPLIGVPMLLLRGLLPPLLLPLRRALCI
jgi:hypothetical protein